MRGQRARARASARQARASARLQRKRKRACVPLRPSRAHLRLVVAATTPSAANPPQRRLRRANARGIALRGALGPHQADADADTNANANAYAASSARPLPETRGPPARGGDLPSPTPPRLPRFQHWGAHARRRGRRRAASAFPPTPPAARASERRGHGPRRLVQGSPAAPLYWSCVDRAARRPPRRAASPARLVSKRACCRNAKSHGKRLRRGAPRFLKTLRRAGSLRAASGRFLKTLGQNLSSLPGGK